MTATHFYIVDVFAERKYAGNQLAVFRNAGHLSTTEMQSIAREMHFSETTFILGEQPASNGGFDVRIFTPAEEVPFAGHPTLGTAHVIRTELLGGQADQVTLNLKVGAIPVTAGAGGYSWMRQVQPVFGPQYSPETLAPVLGLEPAALDDRFPIAEVSTGLAFFIVPLRTLAALQQAKVDLERYYALIEHTTAKGILVFCPETHEPGNQLSARVFVDYFDVPEDPATGSANGCLAAWLVRNRYTGADSIDLQVEQGYEINRPSLLLLRAKAEDEGIAVNVGGKSIIVAHGDFV